MDALNSLRLALNETNRTAFHAFHIEQRSIEAEVRKLQGWLKDPGEAAPPVEVLKESLLRFHRDGRVTNFRDARLVCRGVAVPIGPRQVRLIDDSGLFPRLLDDVAGYAPEPRKFRRCYRGLLSSYFHIDPCAEDDIRPLRDNRQRLQEFLNGHLAHLRVDDINPDWVDTIQEHRNLLSDAPCERYGAAFLNGSSGEFKAAEAHLEISGSSWVGRSIIEATVNAACALDDDGFKPHLPRLFELVGDIRYATLLDGCLARILERYSLTSPLVTHPGLCNFAVAHWKNPWLDINDARWRLVTEAARKMVADWLKLDFLKQFFELLSADGCNDTRRLDFWARYHQRIDDMYFVLGKYAMGNRTPAYVELRKKMEGRLLSLSGGGTRENNAFVMTMGDHAFVEFGTMGNAAYVYKLSRGLPFDLAHSRELSSNDLKNTLYAIERLRHTDNNHGYDKWERRFDSHLYLAYGIRAGDDELPEPWRSGSWLARGTMANIEAFCRAFGFTYEDRRSSGGQFWVKADNGNRTANGQLEAWGFSYRDGRGWLHW